MQIAVLFTSIAFIFRKLGERPMIYFRSCHLKQNTGHGLLIDVLYITRYMYLTHVPTTPYSKPICIMTSQSSCLIAIYKTILYEKC